MFTTVTFTAATASATAITLHGISTAQLTHAEGLVGPPAPRDVINILPGRDGVSDQTAYLSERVITLEGELVGANQGTLLSAWDTLSAALETTMLRPGKLTVTRADGTVRWCNVVLAGAAQPSFDGGAQFLQYQITLRAPDPRWYSTTLNTSVATVTGTADVSNTATAVMGGTAPALPILTFAGAPKQFYQAVFTVPTAYASLAGTAGKLTLSSTPSTSIITATVDSATRISTFSLDATTQWPVFYPGTTSWLWTTLNSGANPNNMTCTASWYNAWW